MRKITYWLNTKDKENYKLWVLEEDCEVQIIENKEAIIDFLDNANWSVNEGKIKLESVMYSEFKELLKNR